MNGLQPWDIIQGKDEFVIYDGFGFLCGYPTRQDAENARREILAQKDDLDGISDETRQKYLLTK